MKDQLGDNSFRSGNLLVGGLLILLGVIFLAGELLNIRIGHLIWPFFVIAPGVLLFLLSMVLNDETGQGVAAFGGLVTMVGLVLFYQRITGHWASWAYAWALVAPTSIGLGMFIYALLKGKTALRQESWKLVKVGLGIFVVSAVFFELIIGVSGFGLGRFGWPILLIAFGVFLLFRNLSAGQRHMPDEKEERHVLDNS